jgi:iron complex transport system ATP-binding protein
MSSLTTRNLTLGYEETIVVDSLSLEFPVGKITALVGGNGSGKSTLLKGLARILKPKYGAAYLDGKAIHSLPTRSVASEVAILPQGPETPEGLTVSELVMYGRFPYRRPLVGVTQQDRDAVARALLLTDMEGLADRPVDSLSGGQRQRAWVAMALAQDTEVLLLDEPTTFLDMAHQLEVLQLLEDLNRREGRTIVMVLHDLNQASRFADCIVGIVEGRVVTQGTPSDVMKPETFRTIFGVEADIINDPRSGCLLCVPYQLAQSEQRR